MEKSIKATQRLFRVEGLAGGEVQVETTKYLLSLPENKQMEVLTEHLENLRKDYAKYERPPAGLGQGKDFAVKKAQLELLIQVTEGLLSQV
jgi:hypothetical protein